MSEQHTGGRYLTLVHSSRRRPITHQEGLTMLLNAAYESGGFDQMMKNREWLYGNVEIRGAPEGDRLTAVGYAAREILFERRAVVTVTDAVLTLVIESGEAVALNAALMDSAATSDPELPHKNISNALMAFSVMMRRHALTTVSLEELARALFSAGIVIRNTDALRLAIHEHNEARETPEIIGLPSDRLHNPRYLILQGGLTVPSGVPRAFLSLLGN